MRTEVVALALDMCVREGLEGDTPPVLSEEARAAMTIYARGALMGARTFEWNEANRSGVLEEEALSDGRPMYQSLLLAGQGCEGFEPGP